MWKKFHICCKMYHRCFAWGGNSIFVSQKFHTKYFLWSFTELTKNPLKFLAAAAGSRQVSSERWMEEKTFWAETHRSWKDYAQVSLLLITTFLKFLFRLIIQSRTKERLPQLIARLHHLFDCWREPFDLLWLSGLSNIATQPLLFPIFSFFFPLEGQPGMFWQAAVRIGLPGTAWQPAGDPGRWHGGWPLTWPWHNFWENLALLFSRIQRTLINDQRSQTEGETMATSAHHWINNISVCYSNHSQLDCHVHAWKSRVKLLLLYHYSAISNYVWMQPK